ncbi:DUF1989 domain-containing protein [Marinibacterium profundimaris]|uniref:Aminomethyltransferase n=1 Tax=Marinibacterium profundimaris TaxID=1679460 RepID=A0A225NG87_9RHOB|nr:urea carboxylase-associated family protein [Marinibacterium profundimaris]OWU68358.1 aminomethyltransferase [Marinibacterium profundimaris]
MTQDDLITIPARHGKAATLKAGQSLRLINTHGTQVVDCWAWRQDDLSEFMSMEATRVWNQRLNPDFGDTFVTNHRNPILTIVEDTSPGVHDSFMAACDRRRYERLGVTEYHRNCFDNMIEAVRELGYEIPHPTLASLNVFMNIAVMPDLRSLDTRPTVTKPGDYITFRAEMDCIVAFSACPQDIVPIQGMEDNIPRDAHFCVLDDGFPDVPGTSTWTPDTK